MTNYATSQDFYQVLAQHLLKCESEYIRSIHIDARVGEMACITVELLVDRDVLQQLAATMTPAKAPASQAKQTDALRQAVASGQAERRFHGTADPVVDPDGELDEPTG